MIKIFSVCLSFLDYLVKMFLLMGDFNSESYQTDLKVFFGFLLLIFGQLVSLRYIINLIQLVQSLLNFLFSIFIPNI